VPFADIIDLIWRARPHAIQFEAANPGHAPEFVMSEQTGIPDGKMLIPGGVDRDIVWAKLASLAEDARIAGAKYW